MAEQVLYYRIEVRGTDVQEQEIGNLSISIRSLNDALKELNKEEKKNAAEIGKVTLQIKELTLQRNALIQQVKKETQSNQAAEGSMIQMEISLQKLNRAYRELSKAERDGAIGAAMLLDIQRQTLALSKLEQATGRFQRQVGNYNTAGMAMSQVLREIPAFTFSAQTGILALSNNIPILIDEFKRLTTAMNGNTKQINGFGGAMKIMIGNLVSLGGIMTILLGLFTIYSDKIFEAISGTKKLTESEKKLAEQHQQAIQSNLDNADSLEVLKGAISATEAEINKLDRSIGIALANIEKETEEKIDSIYGFWNVFITGIKNFGNVFATNADLYKQHLQEIANATKQEQDVLFKAQVDADSELIGIANKYMQQARELRIEFIKDDIAREKAKVEEKRRLALEEASFQPYASSEAKSQAEKQINEFYDLQLSLVDIREAEKTKKKKDKDKEALDTVSMINEAENALIKDKYIQQIAMETENYRQILAGYEKKLVEYPNQVKEINRLIFLAEQQHVANLQKLREDAKKEQQKAESEARIKRLKSVNNTLDDYEKALKESNERIEKDAKQHAHNQEVIFSTLIDFLQNAENEYFRAREEQIRRSLQRTQDMLEADSERQTDILKNRLDKGIITESQYNADKAELDRVTQEKKVAEQKKAFEKEKRLAKAKVALNTAIAITEAYATSGGNYYVATVKAIGITGISLAQMAAIDAQQFAKGGRVEDKPNIPVQPNGDNVLATLTPGEVVLNKQQQEQLGGDATFARIGVPGFPNIYPNASSGGSLSAISKKELSKMFVNLGRTINNKKVYSVEAESRRVRNSVDNYESQSTW